MSRDPPNQLTYTYPPAYRCFIEKLWKSNLNESSLRCLLPIRVYYIYVDSLHFLSAGKRRRRHVQTRQAGRQANILRRHIRFGQLRARREVTGVQLHLQWVWCIIYKKLYHIFHYTPADHIIILIVARL